MDTDDLYERLMAARDLLWEAAVTLRRLEGKSEPEPETHGVDDWDMAEVHRILDQP